MKLSKQRQLRTLAVFCATSVFFASGCTHIKKHHFPRVLADPPRPLGAQLNEINELQAENAEASKYVIYEHECSLPSGDDYRLADAWRLNEAGEDHVKRIAVNLKRGDGFPVVVERSQISPKVESEFHYAIHGNEELDLKRRAVVVAALQAMGVEDADDRVVIAPAFAEGLSGAEANAAYNRSLNGVGRSGFGGSGSSGAGISGGARF